MTNRQSRFEEVIAEMVEIHRKKSADYDGTSGEYANFREAEKLGVPAWKGALIRLTDKYSRLVSLAANDGVGQVTDESIIDTLNDMANYAIIVRILYEEHEDQTIDMADVFNDAVASISSYVNDLAEQITVWFQENPYKTGNVND